MEDYLGGMTCSVVPMVVVMDALIMWIDCDMPEACKGGMMTVVGEMVWDVVWRCW